MTIKQDVVYLVKSYIKAKDIKDEMKQFREQNAKKCSEREYWRNYEKVQLRKNISDSCFFVGPNPKFTLKECINVQDDGFIEKKVCSKCSNFATVEQYSLLVNQLNDVYKERNRAINNLVMVFMPWKKHNNR